MVSNDMDIIVTLTQGGQECASITSSYFASFFNSWHRHSLCLCQTALFFLNGYSTQRSNNQWYRSYLFHCSLLLQTLLYYGCQKHCWYYVYYACFTFINSTMKKRERQLSGRHWFQSRWSVLRVPDSPGVPPCHQLSPQVSGS